jgi:hypothetical protein
MKKEQVYNILSYVVILLALPFIGVYVITTLLLAPIMFFKNHSNKIMDECFGFLKKHNFKLRNHLENQKRINEKYNYNISDISPAIIDGD